MTRITLFLLPALCFLGSCGSDEVTTPTNPATAGAAKEACEGDCTGCTEEHAAAGGAAQQVETAAAAGEQAGEPAEGEHAGCGSGDCTGDCGTASGAAADALVAGGLGTGITMTEFTKISDILADPESFVGKRVLVKGVAVGVCESRGCWVQLKGDEEFQSLRVKVKDGEIVFPMSCLGQEVVAEGVWDKVVIPVETLREALKKQAEAKGETFDPASVTEPRIVWQLRGLGARIDG
ncbi:MAG: DUF4920 domain-containing protein [Planctomycetes bacterium]|nr:DUF4920 domain-containing protein [Planctomycetota bacterium]